MSIERAIICSLKDNEKIRQRYPTRKIIAGVICKASEFYYFNRKGRIRRVMMKDGSVWRCDGRGFNWTKQIRSGRG